jgi:hypothetical protein
MSLHKSWAIPLDEKEAILKNPVYSVEGGFIIDEKLNVNNWVISTLLINVTFK